MVKLMKTTLKIQALRFHQLLYQRQQVRHQQHLLDQVINNQIYRELFLK